MYISRESHLDHNLTFGHLKLILETFGTSEGFSIQTLELPPGLELPCGLHGPIMGDMPVSADEVVLGHRGNRTTVSRLVVRGTRPWSTATVIMGPDDRGQTVLYTVYGGPVAPREPDDAGLSEIERLESQAFWADHALSTSPDDKLLTRI